MKWVPIGNQAKKVLLTFPNVVKNVQGPTFFWPSKRFSNVNCHNLRSSFPGQWIMISKQFMNNMKRKFRENSVKFSFLDYLIYKFL